MLVKDIEEREGFDVYGVWFREFMGDKNFSPMDIITHPAATPDILHWAYQYIGFNRDEKCAYWNVLNVQGDPIEDGIVFCDNVGEFCHIVCRSSDVQNGVYIFGSKSVRASQNVLESAYVDGSHNVYYSNFVYDSDHVMSCDNVNESFVCARSKFVVKSKSIIDCENVENSWFLDDCKNVKFSEFCGRCKNIDHCLLCYGLEDKSYCVFNQEVSPAMFEMLRRQLESFVMREANLVNRWSEDQIPLDKPQITVGTKNKYGNCMKDAFWQWVLTLPQFDSQIVFKLFYKVVLKN